MAPRYTHIAFEGPIGSHKKELARLVASALSGELLQDPTGNPFLEGFYKDEDGAAFQTQLFFFLNRVQILQHLKQPDLFHQIKISDFMLEKDRIYAYLNLTDSELSLYEKLYRMLTAEMVKPDLVVYLQMSTETILESIKKRRETKLYAISPEYVDNVVEAYNRFFFHYQGAPLLIVNANRVDFQKDRTALNDLLAYFQKDLRGVNYFTPQADDYNR